VPYLPTAQLSVYDTPVAWFTSSTFGVPNNHSNLNNTSFPSDCGRLFKRLKLYSVFGAKNCSVCFFIGIECDGHLAQHNFYVFSPNAWNDFP